MDTHFIISFFLDKGQPRDWSESISQSLNIKPNRLHDSSRLMNHYENINLEVTF